MTLSSSRLMEVSRALRRLASPCRLCPHRCGALRLEGQRGRCGAGSDLEVASVCVHYGEEPVLSGGAGVGNVFLAHCSMSCVYCQNHDISQTDARHPMEAGALADRLVRFQEQGCPSVGFVSPTHYLPWVVEALALAVDRGFRLPVIHNGSGYESPEALGLLEGVFQIYLPDARYWSDEYAVRYSRAPGYSKAARDALREMYRQVGPLRAGGDGVAVSGLLVRLLVLPNRISGTGEWLRFIARELSAEVGVSLMSQYNPMHRALEHPLLSRRITPKEYRREQEVLEEEGLRVGYVQGMDSPGEYLPDFRRRSPFR